MVRADVRVVLLIAGVVQLDCLSGPGAVGIVGVHEHGAGGGAGDVDDDGAPSCGEGITRLFHCGGAAQVTVAGGGDDCIGPEMEIWPHGNGVETGGDGVGAGWWRRSWLLGSGVRKKHQPGQGDDGGAGGCGSEEKGAAAHGSPEAGRDGRWGLNSLLPSVAGLTMGSPARPPRRDRS